MSSVTEGRVALRLRTNAGLQTAHDRFAAVAAANQSNDEAQFLKAATGLALEATKPGFRQELTRFGLTIVNPEIYDFVYEYPADKDGVLQPVAGVMSDAALAYLLSRRSSLDAALGSLQSISNENFRTSLSFEETSLAAVQIDFADVCLFRALLHCGKAFRALAQSYNVSAEYALFYRLFAEDRLDPQQVLAALPGLLKYTSKKAEREKARSSLLSAHNEFKKAYQFISTKRQPSGATPYFFEFADLNEAARLAAELQSLADSIRGTAMLPAQPGENDQLARQSISLSKLFAANAPAPRDLLPRYFDRGFFRRGAASWPDRTLGGILPDATPDLLDSFMLGFGLLQSTLYHPYAFSLLVGAPEPAVEGAPPTTEPIFGEISGIAADPEGNLYVADRGDHVIRKVARDGTVTVVAGQKWRSWGEREELVRRTYAGGAGDGVYIRSWNEAPSDIFNDGPRGIACDRNGIVYFTEGDRIMRLGRDGSLTTLAGRPYSSSDFRRGRDGTGSQAVFLSPGHVACDASGNVYVCDVGSVRKITPAGVVTTLAGIPGWEDEDTGYVDGPSAEVRFGYSLRGIVVDSAGHVYINDMENSAVRKIHPDGTTSTLAGGASAAFTHFDGQSSGSGLIAGVVDPRGLALGPDGRLIFGDGTTVRGILPDGTVATLGGHPSKEGFLMGAGENARFPRSGSRRLRHFVVDAQGTLYAANERGDIVRGLPAVTGPTNANFPAPQPYPTPGPADEKPDNWSPVPSPPDAVAGTFGNFAFSNKQVVLAGEGGTATLTGNYQGNLDYLWVSFTNNSGRSLYFSFSGAYYQDPTEPAHRSRPFTMVQEIPSYTTSDEWKVSGASWGWKDGTRGSAYPGSDDWGQSPFANLAFEVVNPDPDTERPQILDVQVIPSEAQSGSSQVQRLQTLIKASDEKSGIYSVQLSFRNSATGDYLNPSVFLSSSDLYAIDPENASSTYRAHLEIPVGAAAASWVLASATVNDRAGNTRHYVRDFWDGYASQPDFAPLPESLLGVYFRTDPQLPFQQTPVDREPPSLTEMEFVPPTVDVTQSPAEVEIRLKVADNSAGAEGFNISVRSPQGREQIWVNSSYEDYLVEGSVLDGVIRAKVIVPRGSEPGAWTIDYLSLGDRANNYRDYSRYDANLPPGLASASLAVVSQGQKATPLLQGVEVVLPDGMQDLDTLAGDQSFSVVLDVSDPEASYRDSWVPIGSVGLRSPSGTHYLWSDFTVWHLVESEAGAGRYEVVFRLPQFSEAGVWQIDYVEMIDSNQVRTYLGATELSALPPAKRNFLVKGLPRRWDQDTFGLAPDRQPVSIDLSNLTLSFNGAEVFAAATVPGGPPGIDLAEHIAFTYDGLTTAPILPGSYEVVAFLDHLTYTGRATGRMTITGLVSDLRITQDPAPVTVYTSETARFSVTATGEGRLTYVWYHNGEQIPQSNRAQLTLTASASKAGRYKVIVTDSKGNSAESAEAQLTVLPAAGWIWDGGEELRLVEAGQKLTLSGRATDVPTGSFVNLQWLKDGRRIPNARGSEFVIESADSSHAGSYAVQVTTNKGTITSAPIRLTIKDSTVLVYSLNGREQSWDTAGRKSGRLTGYLVLDRQTEEPKAAFLWRGSSPSVSRTEVRPDLVASSTGPGRGTRTVVSSTMTTGQYPAQEHETVWLAGDDSIFQLPNRRWIAAPRLLTGWILSKTDDDEAGIGFTVNSLTLNLDRKATETHVGNDFDEVVEALEDTVP